MVEVGHLPVSSIVTSVLCGLIVIISIYSIYSRRSFAHNNTPVSPLTNLAPGAVISLGIFGTFLGIYIGLLNFDTTDINNSIPDLLEGLKTAFITSLCGMSASLLLKYVFGIYDKKDIKAEKASSDDPLVLLRNISSGITSVSDSVTSMNTTILRCFQSEEEFSFVSQIKIIRTDINDLKREIVKSLDEFGEKVSKLGTEAMIEALRNVIDQFNVHLNDLVGEEFKQLKHAMIKLVQWQDNHREAVDEMQKKLSMYIGQVQEAVDLFQNISNSMKTASEHIDSIDGSLSTISVSADDISNHVENLKYQNEHLRNLIESVKDIGDKAKDVLPSISNHITDATTALKEAAELIYDKVDQIGKKLEDSVTTTSERMEGVTEMHSKQVKDTIDKIETNLETVLNTSLKSLGGQLAALSNKFVDDYTPLTDSLRAVVKLAERIKIRNAK